MAGYVVGTQAWYDQTRGRMVQISKELMNPETDQEKRDRLYSEQVYLLEQLEKYATDDLENTPIV